MVSKGAEMRILRGLSSRFLPFGCLVGVYETYASEVVNLLDARSSSCMDRRHQVGKLVPVEDALETAGVLPGLEVGSMRWD